MSRACARPGCCFDANRGQRTCDLHRMGSSYRRADFLLVFVILLAYAGLLLVVAGNGGAPAPLTLTLAALTGLCTGVLLYHLLAR